MKYACMKYFAFCFIAFVFFSCSTPPPPPKDTAFFEFVGTKTNDNNGGPHITELYAIKGKRNIPAMIQFCASRQKKFSQGDYLYMVFFDAKENATFANRADAWWAYGLDEKAMRHMLAYYESTGTNGILDYYENNGWESVAQQIQVDVPNERQGNF